MDSFSNRSASARRYCSVSVQVCWIRHSFGRHGILSETHVVLFNDWGTHRVSEVRLFGSFFDLPTIPSQSVGPEFTLYAIPCLRHVLLYYIKSAASKTSFDALRFMRHSPHSALTEPVFGYFSAGLTTNKSCKSGLRSNTTRAKEH